MRFEQIPVIDKMKGLYNKPISANQFQEYIRELQGNTKGDMRLPISGFNPMAKEHVIQKLDELKTLQAESIIENTLETLNKKIVTIHGDRIIKMVINLADDLKGGWTNYYTTDFDSKFKLNAFVTRNFCTPYFWTSEDYTVELIKIRTLQYAYRTIYWMDNAKPRTLKDYYQQEQFVTSNLDVKSMEKSNAYYTLEKFYLQHIDTDDYALIFNFFYGDKASKSLEFKTFGIEEYTGFDFARGH